MASEWYVMRGQQKLGPFSPGQLKQLAMTGKLAPADLVWMDGLKQPVQASKVTGLFTPAAAAPAAVTAPASPLAAAQPVVPPIVAEMVSEKGRDYYLDDVRNTVWGVAFVAFLPTFALIVMEMSTTSRRRWETGDMLVMGGILAYSLTLATLSFIAGLQCGRGKKSGRILAFIPSILLLFNFPLGTIFSIFALVKLNRREFVRELK